MYISNSIHLIVKESITYALSYMYYVVYYILCRILSFTPFPRESLPILFASKTDHEILI